MFEKINTVEDGLQFRSEGLSPYVIGQFYNSGDATYHLAKYVPYQTPPKEYLCGRNQYGNFPASRNEDSTRRICPDCWMKLLEENT